MVFQCPGELTEQVESTPEKCQQLFLAIGCSQHFPLWLQGNFHRKRNFGLFSWNNENKIIESDHMYFYSIMGAKFTQWLFFSNITPIPADTCSLCGHRRKPSLVSDGQDIVPQQNLGLGWECGTGMVPFHHNLILMLMGRARPATCYNWLLHIKFQFTFNCFMLLNCS